MEEDVRIEDFLTTQKQKEFVYDFFENAEDYEKWENVDFDEVYEMERTFTVTVEDIKNYSEGILDDNPLFNDEEVAAKGPYGGLIAHPLLMTPISFWITGDSGPGSWIRTPGAINPGQTIEFYENIRPGDTIRAKARFYDKWIKRGKRYLTNLTEYYNQDNRLVAKWWGTLILPQSQGGESHKF
ncbi:MAG: MaoC family dehydratase [Deltaproteobacteria bacterium]|nr:MaoC family dehydratase [Deltaproteobacteria bacterium]